MKKEILFAVLLSAGSVFAAQDTTITVRQIRNPHELQTWLQNNAADAESRLASGSTTNADIPLINFNNAGTCTVSMQADKADDAGDKTAMVGSDGSGILFQSDISAKGTLATKATIGTGGLISSLEGFDGIGAVDLDYGSADITDHTFVSDGGTIVLDGTANIPGVITAGSDITVAGDATITSNVTAAAAAISGNATVGGTLGVTGNTTLGGTLDADSITVDAGAGIDVQSAGTLVVGEATATKVEVSKSGVETEVQGTLDVHEGLDVNEDVTVDLDAADEEIAIAQTSAAGTADTPLISINDDRTGATANTPGEATLKIDAEGTHAIGILDGIVAVESVIDTYAAGTLNLGDSTATKVEIADTGVETEIQGTLDAQEDAAFAADVTVTSNLTVSLVIDTDSITVDAAGAGVDVQSAGKLNIGTATADAIDIGKTTEVITLLGPVNTDEAVTMDTTLTVDGLVTCSTNLTVVGNIFSFVNIPTTTNGLAAGTLWSDSNTIKITP